jgi:hypothetical protein
VPAPAGYSGTPLPRKLGIKEGHVIALVGAPDGFRRDTLVPLPDGVTIRAQARGALDVVVFFTTRRAELERRLKRLADLVAPDGAVWVAWPKRASGVATDITEDTLREVGLPMGLVDNKVCAIDDTWSGLRLVIRRENRAAWAKG